MGSEMCIRDSVCAGLVFGELLIGSAGFFGIPTIGAWSAGLITGGSFIGGNLFIGTGPTLWAAPFIASSASGTGILAVGLGTAIAAIAIVVAVVVVPAVLIDRITDAADRAKDYTESDRQDIGGNRAGLIFDLRTVEGDFSRSDSGPAALKASIDVLNTQLAGMRFQRDRTDCG